MHTRLHAHTCFLCWLFLWALLSWFVPLKSLPLGMFAHLDLSSVMHFVIKCYTLTVGFLPAYVDLINYWYLKLVQQDS